MCARTEFLPIRWLLKHVTKSLFAESVWINAEFCLSAGVESNPFGQHGKSPIQWYRTFCVFSNVSRNRCCRNFLGGHRMSSVRRRRIDSFESHRMSPIRWYRIFCVCSDMVPSRRCSELFDVTEFGLSAGVESRRFVQHRMSHIQWYRTSCVCSKMSSSRCCTKFLCGCRMSCFSRRGIASFGSAQNVANPMV